MLDRKDNFCPQCGQENDDKNVSARILFSEFIGTYLSFDSTFFKSLKPFLINPGFLTNQFNSGKRKSYANPIRLYLILSIFYFFIVSIFGLKVIENDDESRKKGSLINYNVESDSSAQYMNKKERDFVLHFDQDSSKTSKNDSIKYSTNQEIDSTHFILSRLNWKLVNDLKNDDEFTDQEILDSMQLGNLSYLENYLAKQVIRINRSDTEAVLKSLFQNLPLMMLAVIPLFALMLKIVYYRSKTLYVKHVIHALHLHSFAYFIYGVGLIIFMYVFFNEKARLVVWIIGYFIVFVYSLISFIRVYQQSFLKTFFKFLLVGLGYSFLIFLFFVLEASLSFLFY